MSAFVIMCNMIECSLGCVHALFCLGFRVHSVLEFRVGPTFFLKALSDESSIVYPETSV